MPKSKLFQNKAFARPSPKQPSAAAAKFNLISQTNNFQSVFEVKKLEKQEEMAIEAILMDGMNPQTSEEKKVKQDIITLTKITAEIKAIGRQGIVLMGERVHRAKTLLKPYRDGTFTKWLETTFGTRKTGYNALSYFVLYNALSLESLREKFKKIPLRIAYILASREGALQLKEQIIQNHYHKAHNELERIIHNEFPVATTDKRLGKISQNRLIREIGDNLRKLHARRKPFSAQNRAALEKIQKLLENMLK